MCKLSQNQKAAPIGSNQVRQMAKSVDVHDDHLLYIKEPPEVAHSMFSFIKAMDIPETENAENADSAENVDNVENATDTQEEEQAEVTE